MTKPEMARAELETADAFGRRGTELDPNDADAWAAWSQVDSWTVYHNFDASAARREAARTKAARALQLAPDSYEARLAQACFLVRGQAGGDTTLSLYAGEAEKLLRALLQEEPDEPRALLASGILYRNTGRFPECREALNRMVRNPAFAVQAWNELGWAEYYAGDYTAAGVAIDHSIALQGFWGNLALKQILAQWWLGDLDLAKSAQDRMPVAARQEDIGIYSAAELAYWRREPEAMLQILDGVPRDWLQSNGFTGPTAWYAGLAHRMAGRAAAAQLQWRTALAVVERR
jgi:tetratricopeptide (TPR) repeat protein